MPDAKLIQPALLKKIERYNWKKFEIYPFDSDVLKKMKRYCLSADDQNFIEHLDINDLSSAIVQAQLMETRLTNLDESALAFIKIQIGKMLNMAQQSLKAYNKSLTTESQKKETWEAMSQRLFDTVAKRAERFKLMSLAKIPKVEDYHFIGITRLNQIVPVVSGSSSPDPIGELLLLAGFSYDIDEEIDVDRFKEIIEIGANSLILTKNNIPYTNSELVEISSKHGIIPQSYAKKIKVSVSRGNTISASIGKTLTPTPKLVAATVDMAPSYNELDETCLKLSKMMEDILDDQYVPPYHPELTAKWLSVLSKLNSDLLDFWSVKWDKFERNI